MAHIIFDTKEKKALESLSLPDGSTLVETAKNGKSLYAYFVQNGKWQVTRDFRELDRDWKRGERKAFEKGITKDDVLDFFLNHQDDGPQREYEAMCDLEYKYFKYIKHSGTYNNGENGEHLNLFMISLNKDSNIKEALREINYVLTKIAFHYPKWDPIEVGIFEYTLSASGSYGVEWDRNSKFVLTHSYRGDVTFKNLTDLLTYIQKYHWYE